MRLRRQLTLLSLLALCVTIGGSVFAADDMPPPKSAPRTKVQQQKLSVEESKGNRIITGTAQAVDAERIKVADTELRLFGVVMPQQAAPHGGDARAALEKMFAGETVTCRIQERDKSWKLLGTCRTSQHEDVSLALLQQGWAVVARGTVQQTNFADLYLAAEAKAQLQKLGMWMPEVKPEVAATSAPAAVAPTPTPAKVETPPAVKEPPVAEKSEAAKAAVPAPVMPSQQPQVPAMQIANTATAAALPAPMVTQILEPSPVWLWFAGLTPAAVMILFALGQIALRRYEYQQERKALAAALRGELMAARAICVSRADTLGYGTEASSRLSTLWPRLRSSVYQAYVGRIGLLGPDLARRVSSLYGQFSDYAQFYAVRPQADIAGKIDPASVRQTLFTIIDHIEDTLNNLQRVEASGNSLSRFVSRKAATAASRPQRLNEKSRIDNPDYIDAEIVEDNGIIRAVAGPKRQPKAAPNLAAPRAITNPDDKADERSEARAADDAIIASAKPARTAEAAPKAKAAAVTPPAEQPVMAQETLAIMTAAHQALHEADELGDEEVDEAALDDEDAMMLAMAPSEPLSPSPVVEKTAAADSGESAPQATDQARPKAKSGNKDDYYDFRSQAIRIAK